MCHGASSMLATATTLSNVALGERELRRLLAAGAASLRLLPLLARLQHEGPGGDVPVAARLLAARCLGAALAAGDALEGAQQRTEVPAAMEVALAQGLQVQAPAGGQPDAVVQRSQELCAAAWQALQPELPQLSAAACRAVHWHAAQGTPGLLPASLLRKVPVLLQALSVPCRAPEFAPSPEDRCAAAPHWSVAQTCIFHLCRKVPPCANDSRRWHGTLPAPFACLPPSLPCLQARAGHGCRPRCRPAGAGSSLCLRPGRRSG